MLPADDSPGRAPQTPAPGARMALLLLLLINLFNYIDRQVLAAVEPYVRADFFPHVLNPATGKMEEPEEAKELMGWLSFAFLATYMFLAPVFGALATRMSRWWLIGIGVIVWSLASGASGAAELMGEQLGGTGILLFGFALPMAYLVMLLTRCLVGVGEAVYGPVAPDLLADMYPVAQRGQVMAWFYAAIPFGGALGYALGEVITGATGHWRHAFYAVVAPGLALGVWSLLLKDQPRSAPNATPGTTARPPAWSDYAHLFRIPSYALNVAGMTFMCFAIGGLSFWAPGYLLHRKVDPVAGLGPATFFGLLTAVLGLAATLLGGLAGDWLRPRHSGSYFLVSGVAMCLGCPLLLLMVFLPFPLAWLPLAGFVFCLFFNTGPTNTVLANVVPSPMRARGYAVAILVMHLLGDAASPTILGRIAGRQNRFDLAFQLVAVIVLLGGLCWLWGAAYLRRDTERAEQIAAPNGR